MQIITIEQAVLNLILEYLDNPRQADFETTLKEIREYWPITEHSMSLDWEFKLTMESLVNLSKKYLKQDFQMSDEGCILLIDSTNFSFKIMTMEEYINDLPRRMDRVYLGL